jgi:hypothetical protein
LWSATSIEGANFSVSERLCIRQCSPDLFSKLRKGSERMPIARDQLTAPGFDAGQSTKAVELQLEYPVGVIEWLLPRLERHWLEWKMHQKESRIGGDAASIQRAGFFWSVGNLVESAT